MLRPGFFNLLIVFSLILWFFLLQEPIQLSVKTLKHYFYNYYTFQPENSENSEMLQREIAKLKLEVSGMKFRLKQHENEPRHAPTLEYEKIRMNLEDSLATIMHTFRGYAETANAGAITKIPEFGRILDLQRDLTSQVWKLEETDGYQEFRRWERKQLGQIVQRRIQALQNPKDCSRARKLLCLVNEACDFGCMAHQVIYCLITAYAKSRTLILRFNDNLETISWNQQLFLPISNTCTDPSGWSTGTWDNDHHSVQVLSVNTSIFPELAEHEGFLPPEIPSDIIPRLERVSREPSIWWMGQFASYVHRFTPETERILVEAKTQYRLDRNSNTTVTVGVHARPSQEVGGELQEYKGHMQEYLAVREKVQGHPLKRNVFVVNKDGNYAQRKAKRIQRRGRNNKVSIHKVDSENRFENRVLPGAFLLAECDYVICSYSSDVCRLVAELIEAKDNSKELGRVMSLDFLYRNSVAKSPTRDYWKPVFVKVAKRVFAF